MYILPVLRLSAHTRAEAGQSVVWVVKEAQSCSKCYGQYGGRRGLDIFVVVSSKDVPVCVSLRPVLDALVSAKGERRANSGWMYSRASNKQHQELSAQTGLGINTLLLSTVQSLLSLPPLDFAGPQSFAATPLSHVC